ncbi:Plastid redox insensitive 2 protein [Thalictrum thalictroides]|uniref:Plastid redox insensitive 2 protein n=1 Tax=Thalictrum thalictroides TaxID=46969 RepID=A0A7J6VCS3_THATH|nr:Plastid redox insensitive 2 protein [Thalictrum thalictroides]
MAWSNSVASTATHLPRNQSPYLCYASSLRPSSPHLLSATSSSFYLSAKLEKNHSPLLQAHLLSVSSQRTKLLCRAAEYQFPDPIPEFAEAETEKFKARLHEKLLKKDIYGGSVKDVLGICTEIFSNFLHTEYGGPGTLLVVPFIDMADTINERGLPGGPQAARSAVVWAQKHVDNDWKEWIGGEDN